LAGLASRHEEYDYWTPQIPIPEGTADRALYVDPIYF
jgi:hypothetical protein